MYHFFAEHENIFDDYIDIKGGDVNHIKNVLRLKKGDEILISSGDNYDYNCIIDTITDDYVRSLITSVYFRDFLKLIKWNLLYRR